MTTNEWVFKRNCAMSPRQMAWALGGLALVSATVALGFWWLGAPWVVFFTALEWLALIVAAYYYSRHASDQERVVIGPNGVLVEHEIAGRVARLTFGLWGLQVQPPSAKQALVSIEGQGQSTTVGRHIRLEARRQLAAQLRHALRAMPMASAG